jgi:hypothetical protein
MVEDPRLQAVVNSMKLGAAPMGGPMLSGPKQEPQKIPIQMLPLLERNDPVLATALCCLAGIITATEARELLDFDAVLAQKRASKPPESNA